VKPFIVDLKLRISVLQGICLPTDLLHAKYGRKEDAEPRTNTGGSCGTPVESSAKTRYYECVIIPNSKR